MWLTIRTKYYYVGRLVILRWFDDNKVASLSISLSYSFQVCMSFTTIFHSEVDYARFILKCCIKDGYIYIPEVIHVAIGCPSGSYLRDCTNY